MEGSADELGAWGAHEQWRFGDDSAADCRVGATEITVGLPPDGWVFAA